jgi:hypothetical protein
MALQHLELPVRPALADVPMKLPVNVLLVLPKSDGITRVSGVFNLPAAINEVLGRESWDQAVRVLNPRIEAPGWSEEQFLRSFSEPIGKKGRTLSAKRLKELRVDESPFQYFSGVRQPPLEYAIRHLTGVFASESRSRARNPLFDLFRFSQFARALERLGLPDKELLALNREHVNAALGIGEVRLMIIETNQQRNSSARRLARHIVELGGPAVLVVVSEDQRSVDEYFTDLYAGIIHNQPLSIAARTENDHVFPYLVHGQGGDQLLRFDLWTQELQSRIELVEARHQDLRIRLKDQFMRSGPIKYYEQYLHRSQLHDLDTLINERVSSGLESLSPKTMALRRNLDFSRESGGVFPLSEIAETLPAAESHLERISASLQSSIDTEVQNAVASAPRVVNANFAEPETKRVLGEREGLIAGGLYQFLVDVGPQWNQAQSIVKGCKEFPEFALPADEEGFTVKVVFVSEEFTPNLAITWMWVPKKTGRSFPYDSARSSDPGGVEPIGRRAETAGPVVLSLTAPEIPADNKEGRITAHGRLGLYYEGNLLQSAVVKVGVVDPSGGVQLDQPNEVSIDFALSSSLQGVEAKFGRRAVWFDNQHKESEGHPVRVNLTLNDDGAGGHRIVVVGRPEDNLPPAAWTQYKPLAANPLLGAARNELLRCFYLRDKNGVELATERTAQNSNNFDQFRFDLRELAKVGYTIFTTVFGEFRTEGGDHLEARDWKTRLRSALREPSLIQVARTVPAEYVLPWALIYDIPMDGSKYPICKIVAKEWANPSGVRTNGQPRLVCPYAAETWHAENVVCPYGFWGLKHIIEQPPSQLERRNGQWEIVDAVSQFAETSQIDLAIAVTRDTALNLSRVDNHISKLTAIKRLRVTPPSPADDLATARKALELPNIVYFLCHGSTEEIAGINQPFLGIGLRDGKPEHKIFPNTIQSWAETAVTPNLAGWSKRRPLVFVNGCHTFALSPEQMLSFVSGFSLARASGVLGTEVSIKLDVAAEIAEILFTKLSQGMKMGVAIREMRWELANKGNLIGLAYTLYGMADLHATTIS